nr:hypothetical transcript [Hymenolepis microstoma]
MCFFYYAFKINENEMNCQAYEGTLNHSDSEIHSTLASCNCILEIKKSQFVLTQSMEFKNEISQANN